MRFLKYTILTSFMSWICAQMRTTRKRIKNTSMTAKTVVWSAKSKSAKLKLKLISFSVLKNPVPKLVKWSVEH